MSQVIHRFPRPLDLAWQLQQELLTDLHLKCSIGVAPNKFLAKMASDMKKTDGYHCPAETGGSGKAVAAAD